MRSDKNDPQKVVFDGSMADAFGLHRTDSGVSQSGYEHNNVFLSRGDQFVDVSGVSGFDHVADGRALSRFDYDRDGWLDLAVVNANRPFLQVFRNEIGERLDIVPDEHAMLALRFVGGNHSDQATEGLAPRDGYGAHAEIEVGGATLVREHRAGEGFAAQNSATMLVGLGKAKQADRLRVRWPSGKTQELEGVAAYSLVTVYEDPSQSADGSGFAVEPYRRPVAVSRLASGLPLRRLDIAPPSKNGNGLRLLTTMATWCNTCKGELPQIARLRRECRVKGRSASG